MSFNFLISVCVNTCFVLIRYLIYFILFVLQLYHSHFCMYFEVELERKLL